MERKQMYKIEALESLVTRREVRKFDCGPSRMNYSLRGSMDPRKRTSNNLPLYTEYDKHIVNGERGDSGSRSEDSAALYF